MYINLVDMTNLQDYAIKRISNTEMNTTSDYVFTSGIAFSILPLIIDDKDGLISYEQFVGITAFSGDPITKSTNQVIYGILDFRLSKLIIPRGIGSTDIAVVADIEGAVATAMDLVRAKVVTTLSTHTSTNYKPVSFTPDIGNTAFQVVGNDYKFNPAEEPSRIWPGTRWQTIYNDGAYLYGAAPTSSQYNINYSVCRSHPLIPRSGVEQYRQWYSTITSAVGTVRYPMGFSGHAKDSTREHDIPAVLIRVWERLS